MSFLSVPESLLEPGSEGSPQRPQAGCGQVQSSQQEACLLGVGAPRVSRRAKSCLFLLVRSASSRGAWGDVRETRRMKRHQGFGGGVLLDPPLLAVPGSSFTGVRGALEAAWALTGQSGSLRETCFRTSPAAATGSRVGERALDLSGHNCQVTLRNPGQHFEEGVMGSEGECVDVCV